MAILHRASWVVPVTSPPIHHGGVIVEQGEIVEVGLLAELQNSYSQTVDHGQGILMPGLVNGHTHLELSHCNATGTLDNPGDMVGWIADLLNYRDTYTGADPALVAAECLSLMEKEGIDLIVDIGNDPSFTRQSSDSQILFFHELLGLSRKGATFMTGILNSGESRYTCHAPYSTNKDLLLTVKNKAENILMPIHVAESLAEMEFLQTGQGDFRQFIEDRGGWDGSFSIPGCSPVQYLYNLGLLDPHTLCVHCVHVDEHDLQLLHQTKAQVCLCIGSNQYLGVGLPPVQDMLTIGLKPCLGTDSLASNPQTSIWREMNLIHQHYPELSAATIVSMATSYGSLALDCPEYGALREKGVSMIFVEYTGATPLEYLSFGTTAKHVARCM